MRLLRWLLGLFVKRPAPGLAQAQAAYDLEVSLMVRAAADRAALRKPMAGATTVERLQFKALRTAAEGAERWHRARARKLGQAIKSDNSARAT